ncbi:RnfH family protein [Duganella sp. CY15W]|uniref:RnfH family protein n=1 Tax=Duganella sp. CY15W TaxID=2692172 RepID=UPI001369FBF8|nr:RnfH family protein [Duganella sp. CY15W]MYM27933.1 RnfH family protein [Duganella sp. CY15W]
MAAETFTIQVCYASDGLQFLRDLQVPPGTTIEQAIALSGVQQEVPGLNLSELQVGIYAKKKTLDTVVREHDRIELYRPLIADPKNARRRRKSAPVEPAA